MKNQKHIAFTEAYHRCQKRFMRYCSVVAYGRMEAEDLVQDVLLATYERFDQIKQKDQLIGYLIRTARNRSIDHWRKHHRQTELLEKHAEALLSSQLSPETALDVQLLYKTLDLLSPKQRDAIILFDICGFNIQEIAAIQQSNGNTVKSHLNRGRKKLRQLLEEKPRSTWLLGLLSGTPDPLLALPVPPSPSVPVVGLPEASAATRLSFQISSFKNLFQMPFQTFQQISFALVFSCAIIALVPQYTSTSLEATPADQQLGTHPNMAAFFPSISPLSIKSKRPFSYSLPQTVPSTTPSAPLSKSVATPNT